MATKPVAKPVAKPAPVAKPVAKPAPVVNTAAAQRTAQLAQQQAAQKAAQQAAAQKAAQQAAQQKAQAAANQAVQQKAAQKAAALKASAEKAAQQQAAQKAAQQQTVARAQAAQKAAQTRTQQIAQQARTPAPVAKPPVQTQPKPTPAPTPAPAPAPVKQPYTPGSLTGQPQQLFKDFDPAAEEYNRRWMADNGISIQGGPAYQQRDPQYAGMPDDMYNNMMAFYQRTGPDGPMTMDVKPWDQWMMMNRPNTGMPPADNGLVLGPDGSPQRTNYALLQQPQQGASGMPGAGFDYNAFMGSPEYSNAMQKAFIGPDGIPRPMTADMTLNPYTGQYGSGSTIGPAQEAYQAYQARTTAPAAGPVNPADINSSLALANPGQMNQGLTGNYQLPMMPNTGIQYPNFQTDPVAAQYVQQASTVRPPTGFSG